MLPFPALLCVTLGLPTPPCEPVRVEALAGRVETLTSLESVELVTGLGPREHAGPGHLESGSLAHARLAWSALASLDIRGRAGLEWRPCATPFVRAYELECADLEVRRGSLRLDLPGGWSACFPCGAYRLAALGGGGLEIETVAGRAPEVWWSENGTLHTIETPTRGARIVLPERASPSLRHGKRELSPVWETVSWPW